MRGNTFILIIQNNIMKHNNIPLYMVLHSALFSALSDQLISGSLITSRDSILERPSNL